MKTLLAIAPWDKDSSAVADLNPETDLRCTDFTFYLSQSFAADPASAGRTGAGTGPTFERPTLLVLAALCLCAPRSRVLRRKSGS